MEPARKLIVAAAAVAALACPLAVADSVVQLWTCSLNEGQSPEDVKAANDRWLAFVNESGKGGVRSAAGYAIVGDITEFIYIDSFPDLQGWAAMDAAMGTAEGQEIEAALDAAATCRTSSLYRMMDSE